MADALSLTLSTPPGFPGSTGFGANNHSLDASNDGVAWLFMSRDANAITHVGFRYGARTGTPPIYRVSLQSPVTTTGAPDGTVLGGGTPASATFTPPADTTWNGTWQWIALDNSYTPARGQCLLVVVEYSSGTVDASNFSSITRDAGAFPLVNNAMPATFVLTAGSWAKNSNYPIFGIRGASHRAGNVMTGTYETRTASTAGHRQAMAFTLPSVLGRTFKVVGARMCASLAQATGKNPIFGLWDATTALQTVTLDTDIDRDAGTMFFLHTLYFDEATLATLSFGTKYYIGLQVADAVNGGLSVNGVQLSEANDLLAYPGYANFHHAAFDGSNWSDAQTIRPFVQLILDDITPRGEGNLLIGVV